jgi:murein DD-endopeptidase
VRLIALLLLAVAAVPHASHAQKRTPLVQSVDVQVPVAPTPVRIAGRRHLVYELHITNLGSDDVQLVAVDIEDAGRRARLASYRGSPLVAMLGRPGVRPDMPDRRRIGGGLRAVLFIWLALDERAAIPSRLRHRIALDATRGPGREPVLLEGAFVEVRRDRPIVLGAPLRGGPWVALYDPPTIDGS